MPLRASERTARTRHDGLVDAATYDDLHGRVVALIIELQDRLTERSRAQLTELADVGEFGVALEMLAAALADSRAMLSQDERASILALTTPTLRKTIEPYLTACPDVP